MAIRKNGEGQGFSAQTNASEPAFTPPPMFDPFGGMGEKRDAETYPWWKPEHAGEWVVARVTRFFVTPPYKPTDAPGSAVELSPCLHSEADKKVPAGYAGLALGLNSFLARRILPADVGGWFGIQYQGKQATASGDMKSYRVVSLTVAQARDFFRTYGHDALWPEAPAAPATAKPDAPF